VSSTSSATVGLSGKNCVVEMRHAIECNERPVRVRDVRACKSVCVWCELCVREFAEKGRKCLPTHHADCRTNSTPGVLSSPNLFFGVLCDWMTEEDKTPEIARFFAITRKMKGKTKKKASMKKGKTKKTPRANDTPHKAAKETHPKGR
jgi:hypothetical protein